MQMIADLRRTISRELVLVGFPPSNENTKYHNRHGDSNPALLEAGIVAGLYPNIAMRQRGDINIRTKSNFRRRSSLH